MDDEDWTFGSISQYDRRQLTRFPSSHHSSALTYFPQKHVVDLLGKKASVEPTEILKDWCETIKDLNKKFGGGYSGIEDPTDVYSYVFSETLATGTYSSAEIAARNSVQNCLRLVMDEVIFDLKALSSAHPALSMFREWNKLSQNDIAAISEEMSRVVSVRLFLEKLRNTVQQNHVAREEGLTKVCTTGPFVVYVMRELYLFIKSFPKKQIILLNYDQILMLFDTVSCRVMTRLALNIADKIQMDNLPSWQLIKNVYKWGDDLIRQYHMGAYAIIGEFESIITGIFVTFQDTDKLNLGSGFMQSIADNAVEVEEEYGISQYAVMELVNLLRSVESLNHLSEIFGLRKHWGNPMVDASASGRAVQDKMEERLPIRGTALFKLLASFNRMIITNFIHQNGKWPEGDFEDCAKDTPIGIAKHSGLTRVPETHPEHRHEHWAYFKFRPNCLIDTYHNDLNLISDKSVSLYRSHLDATYVRNLCKVDVPKTIPEDRRLILEYIREDHLSILDIFKIVMTGTIPEEWLANCASMKGTEMKHHKARIFAVLTYELRQYFVATEDLLKEHLFRYNPHQTMTMSESELLLKLRAVTKQMDPEGDSRYLSVMHIVDFSKWNLRMRYSNTALIFKAIDDFLGTPGLIEQSHIIFTEMINMVQDAFNPPSEGVLKTESDTIWRFHHCGWEGQRQKGWTILTSALLSDLARVTGVSSTICGQGDNQTLLAQFPVPEKYRNPFEWIEAEPEEVRRTVDDFYSRLEAECLAVGLKIKTAETCRSLNFFNYGKRLYVSGVELSMTLKRLSKNITEPNESYPTSESLLKTLEGSAFAAGLYSHPSLLPYIIGRFAVAMQLEACYLRNQLVGNHLQVRMEDERRVRTNVHSMISILMKIPPSLGGPPQLSLSAYLYRGHPDPLCTDLVMTVLRAREGCKRSRQILICAQSGAWFNEDTTDKKSLICSPYSLNLNIPLSCKVPLENEIKPALYGRCKNSLVKGMFTARMDSLEKKILSYLGGLDPFHPLIANDIYARTLPGRRQTFLNGLANTTSLGRLVNENHNEPLVLKVSELEIQQLVFWKERVVGIVKTPETPWIDVPHHVLAENLRGLSWGKTLYGITVPHPLEQFQMVLSNHDVCTDFCHDSQPEHIVVIRHSENLSSLSGIDFNSIVMTRSKAGSPYLGSSVSEGIIQKHLQCVNPDESWRDVIRLNTLRHWITSPGADLDTFLKQLINTRTDVDQNVIEMCTGVPSRISYNHRAALVGTINTCSVSTTTNMHSRLYVSSNRMGRYSRGEYNYHMAFGPTFLCYQELICLAGVMNPESWNNTHRSVYHVHVRKDDVPIVFDSRISLKSYPGEDFVVSGVPSVMFADSKRLKFELPSGSVTSDVWSSLNHATVMDSRLGYCHQLISDSFLRETTICETITQDRMPGYETRPVAVSIGDIGLTGVAAFIRALAWNFLLLAPMSLWCANERIQFQVRASGFIESFSRGFWGAFTTALASESHRQHLVRLCENDKTSNMTLQNSGLQKLLMGGVLQEMWKLYSLLGDSLTTPEAESPVPIFAPTLPALRMLLSRYVEMMVSIALTKCGHNRSLALFHARDFARHILELDFELMRTVMVIIDVHVKKMLEQLDATPIKIPSIKLFPLQHPWIDQLHVLMKPFVEKTSGRQIRAPDSYPDLDKCVHWVLPSKSVLHHVARCNCIPVERSFQLHTECYFILSGHLSKSHVKFIDIVWSLGLRCSGICCLGSSTGTEAFAFARMETCKSVYVNCMHPISGISPHIAGSYVPAAFASGELQEKLIAPSSAVLSSSDLLEDETIGAIVSHIKYSGCNGITCDAEFPTVDTLDLAIRLVYNLIMLCERLPSIEWLICKVAFRCGHEISQLCSIIGSMFSHVRAAASPFSRPGLPLLYLVGSERRPSRLLNWTERFQPVQIADNAELSRLLRYVMQRDVCDLFLSPPSIRDRRLLTLETGDDSFTTSCSKFIPGWRPDKICGDLRAHVLSTLEGAKRALRDRAEDYLRVSSATHTGNVQQKTEILSLGLGALHEKLNIVYTYINRCDLLRQLLQANVLSVRGTMEHILKWVSVDHTYPMETRPFRLELDVNHFIHVASRYLFEVLGHIYGSNFRDVDPQANRLLFHHKTPLQTVHEREDVYEQLPTTEIPPAPFLRWRWDLRSRILSCMLAHYLIGSNVRMNGLTPTYLRHIGAGDLLPFIVDDTDAVNIRWIMSLGDWSSISPNLSTGGFCAIVKVNLFPVVLGVLKNFHLYKAPWSGMVPDVAMVFGEIAEGPHEVRMLFPDFRPLVNAIYRCDSSFSGCYCWDCIVETELCATLKVSHALLDKVCSLGKIETVRDSRHVL